MSKLLNEALGECLHDNYLKESASFSTDVAQFAPLVSPLIKKIYPQSLVEQIASVQPLKSPVGRIAYLNSMYTGDNSNNVNNIHWMNSCLITIDATAGPAVSADGSTVYTANGKDFAVYYKEYTQELVSTFNPAITGTRTGISATDKYCHLLARVITGYPTTGSTMNAEAVTVSSGIVYMGGSPLILTGEVIIGTGVTATALYSTTNRNTIRKVFKDYSTTLEDNSNLLEINFETATNIITTQSRKIRTRFNAEVVQDYKKVYNEKAEEIVAEAIANEIRQNIDREVISYLKNVATPMLKDINIPLSIANNSSGSILDITYDLFFSIFMAIEEIVRATKRNRTMFILADSATCALLSVNPLQTEADPKESNPYFVGKIGGVYPLYCDPYATENYVLVGYKHNAPEKHDAGLYFAPYITTMHEVPDGNNPFINNYITMNRYGYCLHPQDNGTGSGDSDFFRYFAVNYIVNGSVIQNFTPQVKNFYS